MQTRSTGKFATECISLCLSFLIWYDILHYCKEFPTIWTTDCKSSTRSDTSLFTVYTYSFRHNFLARSFLNISVNNRFPPQSGNSFHSVRPIDTDFFVTCTYLRSFNLGWIWLFLMDNNTQGLFHLKSWGGRMGNFCRSPFHIFCQPLPYVYLSPHRPTCRLVMNCEWSPHIFWFHSAPSGSKKE